MVVTSLKSWKIKSTQPFYPLGLRCIGNTASSDRAVITYAAHNVNTFIFRDFIEDIKNDKPAPKSYLHKYFFPECIKDISVGTHESAILFVNGQIKYFTTPKKLMTVAYLSCVKSICATRSGGFVLIKTSTDGTEFSVELHPDSFKENDEQKRRNFNISFEKITPLQSTWHKSCFKIKELSVSAAGVLQTSFADGIGGVAAGSSDSFLFLSIDNNFCCLIFNDESYVVNIVISCTAKIVDFWSSSDGEFIILLLESGTLKILYSNSTRSGLAKKSFHFGTGIQAYHCYEDKFFFSNNFNVECIAFEKRNDEIRFHRECFGLPGIVALTYLPELQSILCISENGTFYHMPIQKEKQKQKQKQNVKQWIEIDGDMQTHISNLKYDLIELTDVYEALLNQQQQQQQIQDVIKLKRNGDECAEINYRFVGNCSVTQTPPPPISISVESFIYLSNSLVYDRAASYFVCVSISYTTEYANEFDVNLWKLSCMWLNDKLEQVYANIRLSKGQLSAQAPLTLIVHLKQKHLPNFHIDLSANVHNGSASLQINFPVKVKQPDYCEMLNISKAKEMDPALIKRSLICTVSTMNTNTIGELLKLREQEKAEPMQSSGEDVFIANLLGRVLTIIHNSENRTLQFITKDADLMNLVKRHFHAKIQINSQQHMRASADAIMEYSTVDNLLSAVHGASEIERNEGTILIAKARHWSSVILNN